MDKRPKHAALADEGLALWEKGKLQEARVLYEEALKIVEPRYFRLPDYHAQYAGVLSALGENNAAEQQYVKAIEAELAESDNAESNSNSVLIWRYYLANHLLVSGKPKESLDSVSNHVPTGGKAKWLLCFVQAQALHDLGRTNEAYGPAMDALELAPTQEKRSELKAALVEKGILKECDG